VRRRSREGSQIRAAPQRERSGRPKVTRGPCEQSQNSHRATTRVIWQAQSDEKVARAISHRGTRRAIRHAQSDERVARAISRLNSLRPNWVVAYHTLNVRLWLVVRIRISAPKGQHGCIAALRPTSKLRGCYAKRPYNQEKANMVALRLYLLRANWMVAYHIKKMDKWGFRGVYVCMLLVMILCWGSMFHLRLWCFFRWSFGGIFVAKVMCQCLFQMRGIIV